MKVMVVDDEADVRSRLSRRVDRSGSRTLGAYS